MVQYLCGILCPGSAGAFLFCTAGILPAFLASLLLAQRARQGPGCDARSLPELLDMAARGAPLGVVLADAEFDSEANHQHIRQRLGAKSIIPARRRGVPNGAIRNQMFRAFPKKPYRQRSKIESIFSAVKRKR